jgi:hypothetical protein
MALEPTPASSQSDARWRVAYVPTADDPESAADVITGDLLTYSFTPDGFNWTTTQATVEDKRLTLDQDLSRPGTLEVKYIDSITAGSAKLVLLEGTEGFLVVRRGVANSTEWAASQKVDIITFVAGAQRPDAPVENGVDTVSQTLYITAPTQRGVTLAA